MFLFTKTAVIKSDLQQIFLSMCFSVYLSNTCSYIFSVIFLNTFIGYMHKLNYWLCDSILKKNQESLYYIRPTDFRFLVG